MDTPKLLGYAKHIARLEATHIERRSAVGDMEELTHALGCRSLVFNRNAWRVSRPKTPLESDEPIVVDTLLKALRFHFHRFAPRNEDGHAILDGLCHNNRWRKCLESQDGTYYLALLLIELAVRKRGMAANGDPDALFEAMAPGVCKLLDAWRGTNDMRTSIPTADEMVRYFFHEIWCDLYLSKPTLTPLEMTRIILREAPPFLPGLMNTEFEAVAHSLPEIESGR
jgi:hypothetical protein